MIGCIPLADKNCSYPAISPAAGFPGRRLIKKHLNGGLFLTGKGLQFLNKFNFIIDFPELDPGEVRYQIVAVN